MRTTAAIARHAHSTMNYIPCLCFECAWIELLQSSPGTFEVLTECARAFQLHLEQGRNGVCNRRQSAAKSISKISSDSVIASAKGLRQGYMRQNWRYCATFGNLNLRGDRSFQDGGFRSAPFGKSYFVEKRGEIYLLDSSDRFTYTRGLNRGSSRRFLLLCGCNAQ